MSNKVTGKVRLIGSGLSAISIRATRGCPIQKQKQSIKARQTTVGRKKRKKPLNAPPTEQKGRGPLSHIQISLGIFLPQGAL